MIFGMWISYQTIVFFPYRENILYTLPPVLIPSFIKIVYIILKILQDQVLGPILTISVTMETMETTISISGKKTNK